MSLAEKVHAVLAEHDLTGDTTDTWVLGHPAVLLTLKAPCNGVAHIRAIRAADLRSATYVSPSTGDWLITIVRPIPGPDPR